MDIKITSLILIIPQKQLLYRMKKLLVIILLVLPFSMNGQVITTVAGGGLGHGGFWGDGGPATNAEFSTSAGLAVDGCGNIYIGDGSNHRVRKIDGATGIITTYAGSATIGYGGDGLVATAASFRSPVALVFDNSGNLYTCDALDYRIRKIDAISGIVSTFAGTGTQGLFGEGDGGPATAAKIFGGDMAWDIYGNMYVADNHIIRKIDPAGKITTIAGTGISGLPADGIPATAANIGWIAGVFTDAKGNIYFTDSSFSVRKITASTGILTRIAGTGAAIATPYTGDYIAATTCVLDPADISVDDTGNIYIADFGNHRIEKVDAFGIIRTIAGTGVAGYSGDGGAATAAQIRIPKNVILGMNVNDIYLVEYSTTSRRVRKISYPVKLTVPSISLSGIVTAPVGATVMLTATVANTGSSYMIHWMNHGIEFTTTATPSVTYTKAVGIDTITARIVAACGGYDSTTSTGHIVGVEGSLGAWSPSTPALTVYPNPATTSLIIVAANKITHITITSLIGQVVFNQFYDIEKTEVNIAGLPNGIYMVKVTGNDGYTATAKVIKQ
jgi:hypothetical protein